MVIRIVKACVQNRVKLEKKVTVKDEMWLSNLLTKYIAEINV